MQFRIIPAFLVFLGSYFPLAVILALQDIAQESWETGICTSWESCTLPTFNNPYLALIGVVIAFICFALTITILRNLRCQYPVQITEAKPIPSELISHSFPYIVSFMGVEYGSQGKIVGLIIFLLWLFLVTYRAGQIILNPILLVIGWKFYEVKASINGHVRIVRILSKVSLIPGIYLCEDVQENYITLGEKQE